MELTDIASISGKGGLFKVIKPGKSGVLLEALDATKARTVASATQRLSLLSEISIYTTTKEGTVALKEVLRKIHQDYKNDLGVDANSDGTELKAFLKSVLPTFDETRVYVSDIKKLVKWYGILLEQAPEVFAEKKSEA
ncbi:MAG: DUF5606 domain-containing protein [Cytophagales bacterium]|nr:DUF5606 domain-containing protein [Cytophagales bacterium]